MNLKQAVSSVNSAIGSLKGSLTQTSNGLDKFRRSAGSSTDTLTRVKGQSDKVSSALTKVRKSADQGGKGLDAVRNAARGADSGLGKARTGTDKFKSSLDKLKGSADKAKNALQDVKRQADAVEKSVGKAGKNADKGGTSMGKLGKGLKGASLAQKGLNLAMAASPFGLIMTLLGPLIAQFINMDKVAALVRKGLVAAWSGIRSASSSAAKFLGPIFKGVVNAFLLPTRMLVRGLNALISGLNHVKFKVPDWVPVIGGKGFAFNLPSIPVPALAQGGIVQARRGGTLALIGEAGEHEAVIPLPKLERMLGRHNGGGAALHRLAQAMERLADRPVHVEVDSQTIARAVFAGQRQLARR
ncbi:hypothetical protein ACNPQM_08150 [Streptomyces sp. NPDC056231]|uniref:hypothetical protein n=1 Tax=unclassified Streptomyces TaxID=2593676 RepID=UPI0033E3E793